MRFIYIDNYRGFNDCYIPILDVNFMVGENSTGKTSILSLLNIFATTNFWFNSDFNQEDVQLGSFKDIISADSTNRDCFRIGIAEYDNKCNTCNRKDAENNFMFLLKFVSKEGLPSISQYSFLQKGNVAITARIREDDKIEFMHERVNLAENTEDELSTLYKKWVKEEFKPEEFKLLKSPFKSRSLIHLSSLIQNEIIAKGNRFEHDFGLHIPGFASDTAWIAPIRTKPNRTYDQYYKINFSPEGEHAPYLIKKLLNQKNIAGSFQEFIKEFGDNSGLFRSIAVSNLGENPESPFQLDVTLNKSPINVTCVGYGVSQCLPIIVELFARQKFSWYFIQQPEVHLHPRAQAALGDIFYRFAAKEHKRFFIETHSDFAIDRYRLNIRKNPETKHSSQVLFFERKENENCVSSLIIDQKGAYPDDQPDTFRSFFINEEMSILGLE